MSSTHFAKQRPTRGMAGFRFRTRTKSKYDRPQPSDSLLTQSLKQLNKFSDVKSSNTSGVVVGGGIRQKKPRAKSAGGLNCFAQAITAEDVKTFFQQLMENTKYDAKPTHRSALNEVIDFQEDVLRAKIATQAVNEQLEQLAQQQLQNLVEDMIEENEIELSSADCSQILRPQNTTKEMILTESSPGRSRLETSSLNVNNSLIATQKLQSTQKLRLSAEGLLDIVTQQTLQGKMSPSMMKRTRPGDRATHDHGKPQGTFDIKEATLLTPILTEPSQGGNSSLRKGIDNRATSSKLSKSTKLRFYPGGKDTAEAISKPKSSLNSINNRAKSSEVADPKILTTKEDPSSNLPPPTFQKTQHSRSNLSKNSSRNSKTKLFGSRKATLSQENLKIEPKNDNEDLRNLVSPDEDENKFSQLAQGGNEANQSSHHDEELSKMNTDVKLVELKLTHHGTTHAKKKRLLSAGIREQKTNFSGPPSQAKDNKLRSITNQNVRREMFSDRRLSNTSKSSKPLLTIGETRQEQLPQTRTEKPSLKQVESDQTWTQHIQMPKIEEKTSRPQYHQVNTLLLSDKSQATMDMKDCSIKSLSRPAPMQLSSPLLKNSDLNSNEQESPDSELDPNQGLKLQIVDQSSAAADLRRPTEEQLEKKKKELQLLLEKEIERLKGNRCLTPQLAFIDPSQLAKKDISRPPEEQLKFLEDTMKEHFKYSGNMQGSRPILSTRQLVQSQLHQKMLENKVLETLKKQNQTEKYDDFVNAQQLASAMMEIVSSNKARGAAGNVILEPREAGKTAQGKTAQLGVTRGVSAENLAMTLKIVELEEEAGTSNINQKGDTLNISLDHNLKQAVQSKSHRGVMGDSSGGSPLRQSLFKKENVKIKVRDAAAIQPTSAQNSIVPVSPHETTIKSSNSRQLYKVPTQLDLAEQENVSVNIATHNRKIVESRKLMSMRRDSRPDTLNQLKSPKANFEMSAQGLISDTTAVQAIKPTEMILNQQGGIVKNKSKSPAARSISQTKSVANMQTRKVLTKMQGGGFNRTQNSGYFKKRAVKIDTSKSARDFNNTNVGTSDDPDSNHAFVGVRTQINPSEVWESQNRGMPLKMTLQVKQPYLEKQKINVPQPQQQTEKSIFSKVVETQVSMAEDKTHLLNQDLKKETKFELFPFKRGCSDRVKMASMMKSSSPLAINELGRQQEMIVVVPSDASLNPQKNNITPPPKVQQQKDINTAQMLRSVNEKVEDKARQEEANAQQVSQEQNAAANIVSDFKQSQKASTKKDIVNQSTLKLRASSNFAKDQSMENAATKLLLLSDTSDRSLKKVNATTSLDFKMESRKERNPALEVAQIKAVQNSHDWQPNKKLESQLSSFDEMHHKNNDLEQDGVKLGSASHVNISSTVQGNGSSEPSVPSLRVHESNLSKEQIITQAIFSKNTEQSQKRETQMSITEKLDEQSSENDESGLSSAVRDHSTTWAQQPQQQLKPQTNPISRVSEAVEEGGTVDSGMVSPRAERRSVLQKSTMRHVDSFHGGVAMTASEAAAEFTSFSLATKGPLVASEPIPVQSAADPVIEDQTDEQNIGDPLKSLHLIDCHLSQPIPAEAGNHPTKATETKLLLKYEPEKQVSRNGEELEKVEQDQSDLASQVRSPQDTCVPSNQEVRGDVKQQQNPRQVIYKNGSMVVLNSADQGAATSQNSSNLPDNTINGEPIVTDSRNRDILEITAQVSLGQHQRQARLATGRLSARQTSSSRGGTKTKFEKGRLTFTQGVSHLMRNFDREFIPKTTQIPHVNDTMLVSTQKELSSRPRPAPKYKELRMMRIEVPVERIDDDHEFGEGNDGDKTLICGLVPPLAQDETLRLLSGSNTIQTPQKLDAIEPIQKDVLVRSKSRPSYTAAAAQKASNRQQTQKSPLIQKRFEVGILSGATSAVFSHQPTRIGSTANATPKSVQSTAMGAKRQLNDRHSRNSKTTQGTLNQTQPVNLSHKRAVSVSHTSAPKLKTGGNRQTHPLEFLALTAINNSKELFKRVETKDRHQGLLIHDQKEVHREEDYAPSESTQHIVMSLNSSRVNHASTRIPNQQFFNADNQLPSRESLVELRKKQKESRQQMLFGSGTFQKPSLLTQPLMSAYQMATQTMKQPGLSDVAIAIQQSGHKRCSSELTPVMMMEIRESKGRALDQNLDSLKDSGHHQAWQVQHKDFGLEKGLNGFDQRRKSQKPSQSFVSSRRSTNVNDNDQVVQQVHHKPPLWGSIVIPARSIERLSMPARQKNPRHSATRRINMTHDELDNLFKDLTKAAAQNQDLNKSSVVVTGTALKSSSGAAPIGVRRRVQSGNPTSKKHRFVQSLSKRSSMLFNNQTVSTKGGGIF